MVQYQTDCTERTGVRGVPERAFSALSDRGRMAILDRLGDGAASISELAEAAGMSLTGMKKHIRIMEEAKLVTTEKQGRTRWCELSNEGFDEAAFWLDEFRRRRHRQQDRLEEVIERKKRERKR